MWCVTCQRELADCTCPDIEERLASLKAPGTHVATTWCRKCKKHAERCSCAIPEFELWWPPTKPEVE